VDSSGQVPDKPAPQAPPQTPQTPAQTPRAPAQPPPRPAQPSPRPVPGQAVPGQAPPGAGQGWHVPRARAESGARGNAPRLDVEAKDRNGRTREADYARRLQRLEGARWKRLVDVQAPYRWNIRRLDLGFTLDVGCGIGRNLRHLGGNGVGVDHNPTSVAIARQAGLRAFTPEEFHESEHARPGGFDSMLVAHVLEHLARDAAPGLIGSYLPFVRAGGQVVLITPQERGYASDTTHVWFVGFEELAELAAALGLAVVRRYSFPLPRFAGRAFTYNEFVVVSRKP
jgi:SAM-dependent methyltransferase